MIEALQAPQEGICTMELVIRKRKYVIGLCTNLLHYSGNYIYYLTVSEILQIIYEFRLIISKKVIIYLISFKVSVFLIGAQFSEKQILNV